MADKSKKIDRYFQLSDSSVNTYGFRLLTTGYQLADYAANPIGYYMHIREDGVVVKWEDLKVEGDVIMGKPCINMSNNRGQQTVDEVDSGFLNAASMGNFVVLEYTFDDAYMLPGQTGPTVTKWFNRECSLVDVPGNYKSLKLFDGEGNELNLADFSKPNKFDMKQIILTAAMLQQLGLADSADTAAAETALANLSAKAKQADALTAQLQQLQADNAKALKDLADLKAATANAEIDGILQKGLDDKKYTKETMANLKDAYKGNPEGLKKLVEGMQPYNSLVANLNAGDDKIAKKYEGKTWEQLDKSGMLEDLKADNLDLFKQMWKDEFGTEYKG